MKNKITILAVILGLFHSSCEKDRLSANGNIKTEVRSLANFSSVHTSSSNPIHIIYGEEYKVSINGSSNLIANFESRISNRKLYLDFRHVHVRNSDLVITVTLPKLEGISLSGTAIIDVKGNFPLVDFFNLDLSGSGAILAADPLQAQEVDFDLSGSGDLIFDKLTAAEADVSISGSGNARLSVTTKLKASISGSGKIYYTGSPAVESHISGSGKIIKF